MDLHDLDRLLAALDALGESPRQRSDGPQVLVTVMDKKRLPEYLAMARELREGGLRQQMITQHDRIRDTVYYSILDGEWPAVKQALEAKLGGST